MGKAFCIVTGCTADSLTSKDIGFFKFPSDKLAKQQWRDQLNMKNKRLPSTSHICSQHFELADYRVTNGKWRLNKDALPLRVGNGDNNGDCGPPFPPILFSEDRLGEGPERPSSPKKYSLRSRRTYNCIIETSSESERENSDTESDSEAKLKSRLKTSKNTQRRPKNKKTTETQNEDTTNYNNATTDTENPIRDKESDKSEVSDKKCVISDVEVKEVDAVKEVDTVMCIDSDEPVDYESLIAQSNLINKKVLNKSQEPAPVMQPVEETTMDIEPPSPDCQMLIENVQVDIDPNTLYMEDDMSTHSADDDLEVIPNAPVEPVSLLTSSDEDEVIIEEPVIPLVEVSDETDEEDMPLTKLHDKHKTKDKEEKMPKTKKKLNSIFIKSGVSDLYCYTCGFTALKRSDFNTHMKGHLKPARVRTIEVCHYCGFTTCSKDALYRHFRKHRHEKRFQCSLCDYKAKHKMSLIYHMKTHNLEDKEKAGAVKKRKNKIKCQECSFETTSNKNLKRHMSRQHRKSSSGDEYRPGD